ncbi:MAG: GNAT family N-acetyltransferase [Acholeplasmataceae bacterium]
MIDKTLPYMSIFMQKKVETPYEHFPLPKGFSFSFYQKNDVIHWAKIELSVNEFNDEKEAIDTFNQVFMIEEDRLHDVMIFIKNEALEYIATGTLWSFNEHIPRLHYIAVDPRFHNQGLAKALISKLLDLSEKMYPKKAVTLTTQTWSHHAVRLYKRFGFKMIKNHPVEDKIYDVLSAQLILKTKEAVTQYLKKRDNTQTSLTIGVFAPSSPAQADDLNAGVEKLKSLGFSVVVAPHCLDSHFDYLAGYDKDRIDDIHALYQDPKVDMLMAMKGGYGTPRIADHLDYALIKKHPKPLIGFSDVTLLLNLIYYHTEQVSYHGPMVVGDFTYDFNEKSYQSFLDVTLKNEHITYDFSNETSVKTITKGITEGILVGGNLTLLCVLIQMVDRSYFKDKILLIEEVNESIYRIDRMLNMLRVAGVFNQIKGLIVGTLSLKNKPDNNKAYQLFKETCGHLDIPFIYHLPFGHEKNRLTCPIGSHMILDATNKTITFLAQRR